MGHIDDYDYDEDDYYWDGDYVIEDDDYPEPDDYEGPEYYHCPVCGEPDYAKCNDEMHQKHDSAASALDPQLDYYSCGRCGKGLRFDSHCEPDEFIAVEHALAVCHPCGMIYTVLHTTDTRRIIAVYPGTGGVYEGEWEDQKEEDLGNFGLPF